VSNFSLYVSVVKKFIYTLRIYIIFFYVHIDFFSHYFENFVSLLDNPNFIFTYTDFFPLYFKSVLFVCLLLCLAGEQLLYMLVWSKSLYIWVIIKNQKKSCPSPFFWNSPVLTFFLNSEKLNMMVFFDLSRAIIYFQLYKKKIYIVVCSIFVVKQVSWYITLCECIRIIYFCLDIN